MPKNVHLTFGPTAGEGTCTALVGVSMVLSNVAGFAQWNGTKVINGLTMKMKLTCLGDSWELAVVSGSDYVMQHVDTLSWTCPPSLDMNFAALNFTSGCVGTVTGEVTA